MSSTIISDSTGRVRYPKEIIDTILTETRPVADDRFDSARIAAAASAAAATF